MIICIKTDNKNLESILKQVDALKTVSIVNDCKNPSITIIDEENGYTMLHAGKSSFIAKPVSVSSISTSIISALNECFYNVKEAFFYPWRRSILKNGEVLNLTEKESQLLYFLLLNDKKTNSKKDILKYIWGYSENVETATLEAHIFRLRNKLSSFGIEDFIVTFESGYIIT